jgi:hypothetical protein
VELMAYGRGLTDHNFEAALVLYVPLLYAPVCGTIDAKLLSDKGTHSSAVMFRVNLSDCI